MLKKKKKQAHRYRKQFGGCQRWKIGGRGEMGEGAKIYKLPVIKICDGDVMVSMVTIVNNTVLHI